MSKKLKKLKLEACVAKRCMSKLLMMIVHFFETVWAIGGSVAATMVISASTRSLKYNWVIRRRAVLIAGLSLG